MDIQEKDRHNIVLANPPFGGKERKEVQQNFPIQTSETALPVFATLHAYAQGWWKRCCRHQEYLLVKQR